MDVRPDGFVHEVFSLAVLVRAEQGLYCRGDPVSDGTQTGRLIAGRTLQLFDGGCDRATARVTKDHDETGGKLSRGEFDAADLGWTDNVARDADHEKVAQPLIENDLYRSPRIGTSQDNRERFLTGDKITTTGCTDHGVAALNIRRESTVSLSEAL